MKSKNTTVQALSSPSDEQITRTKGSKAARRIESSEDEDAPRLREADQVDVATSTLKSSKSTEAVPL